MPKNTKGGSGHKRQARKHTTGGYQNNKTRFSDDPLEMYAVCTKLYGQGNIEVMCHDGVSRMCVIRKKFKGRGKRDNNIILGTWLLVGKREFEVRATGKKEKCDLLEVYRDHDKAKLQQHESDISWSILKSQAPEGTEAEDDDVFQFVDERTMKYTDMISDNTTQENTTKENKVISSDKDVTFMEADDDDSIGFGNNGEIDIDDI